MRRIAVWSAVVVLSAGAVGAQTSGSPSPRGGSTPSSVGGGSTGLPEDEAPAAFLQAMRIQFNPGMARYLGVTSSEDLDYTQTGRAIRTFRLNVDQLQTYATSAAAMPDDTPFLTRLITVRGEVRSAISLTRFNGRWRVSRVGQSTRAKAIDRISTTLASVQGVVPESMFLVVLPVVAEFLAFRSGSSITMASLWDAPELGLVSGQPQDVTQLLAALSAAAR
jgi:hypothetical protein